MPINTAERRRAVAHVSRVWSGKGLTPNAAKDVEWRQQVAWSYSGIAPSGAVAYVRPSQLPLVGIGCILWAFLTAQGLYSSIRSVPDMFGLFSIGR